jgi:putative flippase GtrA
MNINFKAGQIYRILPSKLFSRYIIVGAWNTLFGYSVYVCLTWVFTGRIPYGYMAAAVAGNIISITQSFLSYKFLVFKTRGNYMQEYIRCWVVYGSSFLVGLIMLPIAVNLMRLVLPEENIGMAPYIGGAILLIFTVLISFIGHREFSFKVK